MNGDPESGARTFAVEVLGCKVNQYEAQRIREWLESLGWRAATGGARPRLAVIHGCAVTAEALRQSRQVLRRYERCPAVIFSGCGAAASVPDASGADRVVYVATGPGWEQRMWDAIRSVVGSESTCGDVPRFVQRFRGHARAYVKVQDGCDRACAYCIVPKLRGPSRDRPLEEVEAEARALVRAGHRELVISGVCVGLYGRRGGPGLPELLRRLERVEGLLRIRLSSLHPAELTDELLEVWSRSTRMAPHAHLPLQSGSDHVLQRMGRGYTTEEFARAVDRLRKTLPDPAITTDLIAGFPGETEEDVEQTMEFARAMGFARIHVFRFSARPGTRAASMGPSVPAAVITARAARLRHLASELAEDFSRRFVGQIVNVLPECRDPRTGCWLGHCPRYLRVVFRGDGITGHEPVEVRVTAADDQGVSGEVYDTNGEPGGK